MTNKQREEAEKTRIKLQEYNRTDTIRPLGPVGGGEFVGETDGAWCGPTCEIPVLERLQNIKRETTNAYNKRMRELNRAISLVEQSDPERILKEVNAVIYEHD